MHSGRKLPWMFVGAAALAGFAVAATPAPQSAAPQATYAAAMEKHRAARNQALRSNPNSPLALVHREVLGERKALSVGGPGADLRLPRASGPHFQLTDAAQGKFVASRAGGASVQLVDGRSASQLDAAAGLFRFGDYVLHFRPSGLAQGPVLDVYDSRSPAQLQFTGIDFFPVSEAYRVPAQLAPLPSPQRIVLVDSHGFDRPYWIYGHLSFRVNGNTVRMEVYSPTLDWTEIARDGFMLIFADQTSGKDTYSAGRYLYIAGVRSGAVEVDFNKAYNPQCSFSAAYTCPFPRKENRLAVAIRAGEKTYTGAAAPLLVASSSGKSKQ